MLHTYKEAKSGNTDGFTLSLNDKDFLRLGGKRRSAKHQPRNSSIFKTNIKSKRLDLTPPISPLSAPVTLRSYQLAKKRPVVYSFSWSFPLSLQLSPYFPSIVDGFHSIFPSISVKQLCLGLQISNKSLIDNRVAFSSPLMSPVALSFLLLRLI